MSIHARGDDDGMVAATYVGVQTSTDRHSPTANSMFVTNSAMAAKLHASPPGMRRFAVRAMSNVWWRLVAEETEPSAKTKAKDSTPTMHSAMTIMT